MVTEMFEDAFHSGTSGCVRTCDCGITYFDEDDTAIDWDERELEDLQLNAKENPGKYIGVDYSVSTMEIGGKQIVIGCQCNGAEKYEDFIDQHDRSIARYLNKKAEMLRSEAESIKVKGDEG